MTVSLFSIPQLAGSDDRQYYIIRCKYSSSSNYIIGQMESKCNGLVCLAEGEFSLSHWKTSQKWEKRVPVKLIQNPMEFFWFYWEILVHDLSIKIVVTLCVIQQMNRPVWWPWLSHEHFSPSIAQLWQSETHKVRLVSAKCETQVELDFLLLKQRISTSGLWT